jgi:hypothetical protein
MSKEKVGYALPIEPKQFCHNKNNNKVIKNALFAVLVALVNVLFSYSAKHTAGVPQSH